MRIIFYLLVAGVAGVVSAGGSFAIWKLSHKYRLYPKIRERDVHTRPTPRLGGLAMFVAIAVAFAVGSQLPPLALIFAAPQQVYAVLGAALLIVIIGVVDDIWDLDWFTKLAGQIIAAGLLAWQGVQIASVPVFGTIALLAPYQSLILTIFVVVLVMNAVNFIDGLDGLVAGVAIIASSAFFIYGYAISYGPTEQSDYFNLAQFIAAALIGACLGFLPFNWRISDARPARLFMGDAGALLVGLLMATSTVALAGQIDPETTSATHALPTFIPVILPLAVLIVPIVDFTLAVLRRLRAGKSPFSADRKHLHHRLLDMGHSHRHAVWIFYAWTTVAAGGMLLLIPAPLWVGALVMVTGFLICTIVTLSPLSRRKAVEAAVQLSDPATAADKALAPFDALDAASETIDSAAEPSDAQTDAALRLLNDSKGTA
ncbi:MAG: MraY family glycosyltransferase [Pseudolysinimonas sp.]|uniref:MraY family glycosyltransferase n=1 Tax=Pseudolysinimonas sp. TaxID=2680009 RepID=UPI003263548F